MINYTLYQMRSLCQDLIALSKSLFVEIGHIDVVKR